MSTIYRTFNSALDCLTTPFQSYVRTRGTANAVCCVNTTVTGASMASIIAGAIFSNPAAIAAGAVVCPIAVCNAFVSRDYRVIQSEKKSLGLELQTLKLLKATAETPQVTAAGVGVIESAIAVDVRGEDGDNARLKAEIERLTSGNSSLQAELSETKEALASMSQVKDVAIHQAEELVTENRGLSETVAKVEAESAVLRGDAQAKEEHVEKLGRVVKEFQVQISGQQVLVATLDRLLVIEKALRQFKSEDLLGYEGLIARFPGLALPV